MKKISDDLYNLIKELNKSEKAYFKKYSKLFSSDDTAYLELFNAIEKQVKKKNDYREDEIKTSLKNRNILKQFPVAKTKLYNQVIKNAVHYNFDNTDDSKLHYLIGGIILLYNKTLFEQAEKLLTRAKKFAKETENFLRLYQLLQWEKNLILQNESDNAHEKFNKIYKEEKYCIEALGEASAIKNIYCRAAAILQLWGHNRPGKGIQEFKKLMEEPVMKSDGDKLKAFSHKTFFYDIFVQYAAYTRDFESYYNYTHKSYKLFETYPHQKKKRVIDYVLTFNNLLAGCLYMKNFSMYKRTMAEYEQFIKTEKRMNTGYLKMLDVLLRKHDLIFYNASGRFTEGAKYLEEYIKKVYEQNVDADARELNLINYFASLLYFGNGDYSKALEYANMIINQGEPEQRKEIFLAAKIICIIIHYELGNMEYMESVIRSCYRYLLSRELEYKFEKYMIGFFKKSLDITDGRKMREHVEECRRKIQKFRNDPLEIPGLFYFDYDAWLESKIINKTYAEIILKKNAVTQSE